jgi:hypothetical protein
VDCPPSWEGEARDGVDVLLMLAGEDEGPAVIVSAMLLALGEHATLDYAPGMPFVRVELEFGDLAKLPPHAGLIQARGRFYLPLDARRARGPLGFLPRELRLAIARP